MGLDKLNRLKSIERRNLHLEKLQDKIYDEFMIEHVRNNFFDKMAEYISDDDIDIMRSVLAHYNDTSIEAAISIPYELQDKTFKRFEYKIDNGIAPDEVMREHIENSKKYKFTIGYHTSSADIRKVENGKWDIRPTENDHRDNDLRRMYYSKRSRHLYKKNGNNIPEYIYVVRGEASDNTDGGWLRRSGASIITRVSYKKVFSFVNEEVQKIIQVEEKGQ